VFYHVDVTYILWLAIRNGMNLADWANYITAAGSLLAGLSLFSGFYLYKKSTDHRLQAGGLLTERADPCI